MKVILYLCFQLELQALGFIFWDPSPLVSSVSVGALLCGRRAPLVL